MANQEFEATAEQYRLLARKTINQEDLHRYVKRVLKVKEDEEPSTRTANTIAEIIGLCESGRGNTLPSIRNTLWSSYNGVSEWLSYNRGHGTDSRINSLWFGDSANLNKHALQTALEMAV